MQFNRKSNMNPFKLVRLSTCESLGPVVYGQFIKTLESKGINCTACALNVVFAKLLADSSRVYLKINHHKRKIEWIVATEPVEDHKVLTELDIRQMIDSHYSCSAVEAEVVPTAGVEFSISEVSLPRVEARISAITSSIERLQRELEVCVRIQKYLSESVAQCS